MKNRYIELERFIASCFVLLYHLGVAKGSWIFVEFFFMLTGYFTMSHIERKRDAIAENTWYPIQYTWNKFLKIAPYTGLSIVAIWILRIFEWDLSLKEAFRWLLCLPAELMLIAGSGMLPVGLQISDTVSTIRIMNGHLWYICSMLFVLPIVVVLLAYAKKAKSLILTVLPMLLYGILIMKDGTVDGWHDPSYGFVFCNMRAMAGLLLGAMAYYVSQWWKSRQYTALGKTFLTTLEVLAFVAVAFISYSTRLRFDALQIGLLFLSISLTNAGVTYTTEIKNEKIDFLGAISLPIYCLQMPVIICSDLFRIKNPGFAFVMTLVISILCTVAFNHISKGYNRNKKKICRLFISE